MIAFSFWNSKGEGSETVAVPNQPDHGQAPERPRDASRDQHLSANGCNFRCNKTTSQKKMKSFFSIRPTRRSMEAELSVRTWAAVERKRKIPNIRNFHFLRLSVSFWSAFIVKLNHSWNTREINRIGWQVWPRIDALRTDTIQFRCAHTMHLTSSEKWQVKNS